MTSQSDLIDLILPVSGNYQLTRNCLDSIFKNTNYPFKLIIVDNGIEEPELLEFLTDFKKAHDNIRLVAADTNKGYANALNKGLDISSSGFVAILNNAVTFSKNWLEKLKNGLDSNPNVSIIAPMCNNRFIPNIDVRFAPNKDIELQLEEFNSYLEQNAKSGIMEVPYALGYCMLIKRAVIDKCGGFDSIFGDSIYFADYDFCFRAAKYGFKMFVSNTTLIYRDNSDLDNIHHPKVKLPINYTIFSLKWKNHEFYKFLPPEMFPHTQEEHQKRDEQGFYYNKNLKPTPKKYLLIHPSIVDTQYFWKFAYGGAIAPTGILRIAHYLMNEGHKIYLYDFEPYNPDFPKQKTDIQAKEDLFLYGKPIDDFINHLNKFDDIEEVMITCTMTYQYPHLGQLIEKIRSVYGDIKITVGGLYPTLCSDEVKELGVEVHKGSYFTADSLRPLIEITTGKNSAIMRVVKGCPRTCSYCVVPGLEGRKVTHYQKDDIIRQFQEFYAMGYTNYMFWDSNLLFGKENLYKLFDYMFEYGYHETITLDFSYGLEFALIDDTFIGKLRRFKLRSVLNVPLESSEYELYKSRFHRPNNHLGVMTETVQRLQKNEFRRMHFYVMLGLPGQTLDQVLKTVIFGWRLGLAPFMMLYTPIPGTEDFPKYLDYYKDLKTWELNPFLYPCESEELTKETLLYMHEFNFYSLRYSKEEDFHLEGPVALSDKPLETRVARRKIYFNDQNPILKRIKELIHEEEVRVEEIDDKTLRFLHAINL